MIESEHEHWRPTDVRLWWQWRFMWEMILSVIPVWLIGKQFVVSVIRSVYCDLFNRMRVEVVTSLATMALSHLHLLYRCLKGLMVLPKLCGEHHLAAFLISSSLRAAWNFVDRMHIKLACMQFMCRHSLCFTKHASVFALDQSPDCYCEKCHLIRLSLHEAVGRFLTLGCLCYQSV